MPFTYGKDYNPNKIENSSHWQIDKKFDNEDEMLYDVNIEMQSAFSLSKFIKKKEVPGRPEI